MKRQLVNLTPHALNILAADNRMITLPSSAVVRLRETRWLVDLVEVDGHAIHVRQIVYSEPSTLPPARPGVCYVVSALVAEHINRDDFLVPGPAIRDADGRVVGCDGLVVIKRPSTDNGGGCP